MHEVSSVYTSPFLDTDDLKMALRARKLSGAFEKRVPGPESANAEQRRQQRERNVLKMAVAIVLGCAVCLLPLSIFWFILILTDMNIWLNCGVPYFLYVVCFMARANSAVNPCICFIFRSNYRKELKALLE